MLVCPGAFYSGVGERGFRGADFLKLPPLPDAVFVRAVFPLSASAVLAEAGFLRFAAYIRR